MPINLFSFGTMYPYTIQFDKYKKYILFYVMRDTILPQYILAFKSSLNS